MSVRNHHNRHSNLNVFKFFEGHFGISLSREDTYLQNKSKLYYIMKKIESGKMQLPIPSKYFKTENRYYSFMVKLNNTLQFEGFI